MKRLVVLSIVAAVAAAAAVPAFGGDTGSVPAHVTVAAPCITVGPDTGIDFGTQPFNAAASGAPAANGLPLLTVTNCGSSANVYVKGTEPTSATSSATWALTSTAIAKNVSRIALVQQASLTPAVQYVTTTSQLWRAIPAGDSDSIVATLTMPLLGSDGAAETMNFRITFTASL